MSPCVLQLIGTAQSEPLDDSQQRDDSEQYEAILAKSREALQLANDAQYTAAEEALIHAVQQWDEFIKQHPDHPNAQAQRDYYHSQIEYVVYKPLGDGIKLAKKLVSEGRLREATELYLDLANRHEQAIAKHDSKVFKDNLSFCLDLAGHAPIRYADELMDQQNYAEAATLYKLGIDTYHHVHERIGEAKYAQKIEYATEKMHRARFANAVDQNLQAPALKLNTFDNETIALSDYQGKPVLVVVWASWCGACAKAMPEIDDWYNDQRDQVGVIAINVDAIEGWDRGQIDKAEQFAEQFNFDIVQGDLNVINQLGAPGSVPTLIWIDARGRFFKQVDSDHRSGEDLNRDLDAMP